MFVLLPLEATFDLRISCNLTRIFFWKSSRWTFSSSRWVPTLVLTEKKTSQSWRARCWGVFPHSVQPLLTCMAGIRSCFGFERCQHGDGFLFFLSFFFFAITKICRLGSSFSSSDAFCAAIDTKIFASFVVLRLLFAVTVCPEIFFALIEEHLQILCNCKFYWNTNNIDSDDYWTDL